ncbi:MAG: 4-hydroxythreonine-4-phosphate dehydrogenase PdxA [Candidatus Amulumruptor caecigallinarius]|nr:4-hydroxythreonine-4-phosphate dehydrogenase PdxA [Candidatus Amulumruptor caecigallinarius]
MKMGKPRVGITHGDFNGIGYEVLLKAVCAEGICDLFTPVIFGDWRIIEYARKNLLPDMPQMQRIRDASEVKDGRINVVDLRIQDVDITPGKPTQASGKAAVASLEAAVDAVNGGMVDVIVTAPICKEACQSESFHFPGHTEYLEAHAGEDCKAQMILFSDSLRVALVTTHLPVSEISGAITKEKVVDSIKRLAGTLVSDFSIERPKIAVLSLNPHNGDGGLLGNEEKDVIEPAVAESESDRVMAFGPYAADGFFGSGMYKQFDGILAMYHDQGLAPFKALAGERGVNFTAGLPFVRTSPDHGTAFDIAWKGKADPTSMREAIYRAIDIWRNRSVYRRASRNPLRKAKLERTADIAIGDTNDSKEL